MAKKKKYKKYKQHKQPEFFEAISSTATFPIPATPDVSLPESAVPEAKHPAQWEDRAGKALDEFSDLIWAGAVDAKRQLGKFARSALNKQARRTYLVMAFLSLALVTGGVLLVASSTYAIYSADLASPAALANKQKTGTTILDRNGKVLYEVYGASERVSVSYPEVPKPLINATLAAEDAGFFDHPGFSVRGIARALYKNVMHRGTVEGGSTLTQQLIKNTLLTSERSLMRKVQELALATEVERRYNKEQIMEMYLNDIYYGEGSYGVGTAAKTYFNKPVQSLTLGETALLAGLPLGPSRFDPAVYPEAARARRDFVLDRMHQLGHITAEHLNLAKAEPIKASARQINIRAPHFVFYVLDELRQKYGDEAVEHGGITVTTTLDLDKQNLAQNLTRQQIEKLRGRRVTNAALVALEPKSGEIMSMVGSYDYNDAGFGTVNLTTALRQPGSSMKPICYLAGFTKGMTGATPLDDKPLSIADGSGQMYKPTNYDEKFRGVVTLRRALANSLNVPAVNMLKQIGVSTCLDMAQSLGITTLNTPERYGLSLTLGAGEVKMVDMAAAYGTIANGGIKVTPVAIKQVKDRNGADITKKPVTPPDTKPVVDPRYAYMMSNILADNEAKKEIFGTNTPFRIAPHEVAVKTGTTNDFRDNWTAGYTRDIVTIVWAGNNDNTPMGRVDGFTGAAPIWHDYMAEYLKGKPAHSFAKPAGIILQRVCYMGDGGLANPWDSRTVEEVFLAESPLKRKCSTAKPAEPKPEDKKEGDQSNSGNGNVGGGTLPSPSPGPSPDPEPDPDPDPSPSPMQIPRRR
jgi:1A family penicillin-binding protein